MPDLQKVVPLAEPTYPTELTGKSSVLYDLPSPNWSDKKSHTVPTVAFTGSLVLYLHQPIKQNNVQLST